MKEVVGSQNLLQFLGEMRFLRPLGLLRRIRRTNKVRESESSYRKTVKDGPVGGVFCQD